MTITLSGGVGTRRSASRDPPAQCTVPVIRLRAQPETHAAGRATRDETYPSPTAATAAGISTSVNGTTARLAGIPIVVARWK